MRCTRLASNKNLGLQQQYTVRSAKCEVASASALTWPLKESTLRISNSNCCFCVHWLAAGGWGEVPGPGPVPWGSLAAVLAPLPFNLWDQLSRIIIQLGDGKLVCIVSSIPFLELKPIEWKWTTTL
jgi:hypothetical protein